MCQVLGRKQTEYLFNNKGGGEWEYNPFSPPNPPHPQATSAYFGFRAAFKLKDLRVCLSTALSVVWQGAVILSHTEHRFFFIDFNINDCYFSDIVSKPDNLFFKE